MTCIAICKNRQGKLMMAGDRRVSWGWDKAQSWHRPKIMAIRNGHRKDENGKYFKTGDLLLGGTGDCFLLHLFIDVMKIPKRGNKDLMQYMFNDFYNAIYAELMSHGMGDEHNLLKIPESSGAEIIVGIEGSVFSFEIDNQELGKESSQGLISIYESNVPYATGCGDDAHTVLNYILEEKKYISEKDLEKSVKIMGKVSPGCDDKVDLIKEE